MKKEKKLKLLIIVLTMLFGIEPAKADPFMQAVVSSVPNQSPTTQTTYNPNRGNVTTAKPSNNNVEPGGQCVREYCNVNRYYSMTSSVYVDMYDMYGNKIANVLAPQTSFLAGTYVGFNIYEKNTFFSWATYEYSYHKKICTCKQIHTYCAKYNKTGSVCIEYGSNTTEHKQDCNCNGYNGGGTCQWVGGGGNESACAAQAQPWNYTINAQSYNIMYNDSNDIGTTVSSNERYNTIGNSLTENCGDYEENVTIEKEEIKLNGKDGTQCEQSYNRKDACINVKNGKVSYKIDESGNCKEDEYKVYAEYDQNGNFKYWKYFIPLNANSKKGFSIYLNGKEVRNGGLCQDIIKNYNDYTNRIAKKDGSPLSGHYHNDLEEVKNGCLYQSIIKIPVIQRFYNELENGKNFKGFNFYYKPIDIDNPFPNGLTNTSIWYDWNESDVKNPDLSDSYDGTPTYVAYTSGNENSIRQYNKLEEYTSWDNMYVSGVSKFIENENIIQRNVDRDSFYALGCGPKNTNVTNVFQQTECDTK